MPTGEDDDLGRGYIVNVGLETRAESGYIIIQTLFLCVALSASSLDLSGSSNRRRFAARPDVVPPTPMKYPAPLLLFAIGLPLGCLVTSRTLGTPVQLAVRCRDHVLVAQSR